MRAPLVELMDEGIEALKRSDAACLTALARRAAALQGRVTPADRKEAAGRHRALGRFLELTGRNIQLLGGSVGRTETYGSLYR